MEKLEKQRYTSIDCLKAICAFLVICIHQPFPGITGGFLGPITRVAAPLFFVITGFFYNVADKKSKESIQIHKIFLLIIKTNLFYFILRFFYRLLKGESLKQFLLICFNKQVIFDFLLFNESPFYGHLWYLSASLYVLLIVYWANKYHKMKYLYYITPLLLIINVILGNYSYVILGKRFSYIISRNFVFIGIPYFCIGNLIKVIWESEKNVEKIKKCKYIILFGIIIFGILSLIEFKILLDTNNLSTYEHYISTPFLVISIFLYTLLINKQRLDDNFLIKMISEIGQKYSLIIYIIHPAMIMGIPIIINLLTNYIPVIQKVYLPTAPILIFFLSLLAAIIWQYIQNHNLKH